MFKDKSIFYGLKKIFKCMLKKYRISNIFPNHIQYNILKNRLMLFIKQVWPSLNHTSDMIALPVLHYNLVLIKSILQHKAQTPTNVFGSRPYYPIKKFVNKTYSAITQSMTLIQLADHDCILKFKSPL